MSKNVHITIRSGESVQKEDSPSHPYRAAVEGKRIVDSCLSKKRSYELFSNNPDFASAIWWYVETNNLPVNISLYLDNEKVDELDDLFNDWNRSLDFISEISKNEY